MPKCSECGYLSWRSPSGFEEVDESNRGRFTIQSRPPLCFLREPSFAEERSIIRKTEELYDPNMIDGLIHRERECDSFTVWSQGFTPKEHLEMSFMQKLREMESARDASRQEWQERVFSQQADRDEKWRKEDRDATRRNTWIAFAGLAIAAISPVASHFLQRFSPEKPPTVNIVVDRDLITNGGAATVQNPIAP